MGSVKGKIILLMVFASSMIVGFGYLSIVSYNKYSKANERYRSSVLLSKHIVLLKRRPFRKNTLKQLQEKRKQIKQKNRMKALSDLIQSYADKNRRLFIKRKKFFLQNEEEYQKYALATVQYLDRRITYYGLVSVGSTLATLFLLLIYIQSSVFSPIKELSRRMIDFLNNKYTYQFIVPAQNEVGHLHATFNSLAQRVLANMEELKSLDKAKSEFLSIASHELRTPLTSIKGSLSLLNHGIAGEINDAAKKINWNS